MQSRLIALVVLLAGLVVAVVIATSGGDDEGSEPLTKPEVEVPDGPLRASSRSQRSPRETAPRRRAATR